MAFVIIYELVGAVTSHHSAEYNCLHVHTCHDTSLLSLGHDVIQFYFHVFLNCSYQSILPNKHHYVKCNDPWVPGHGSYMYGVSSLPQHCQAGWETAQPSIVPPQPPVDLKSSVGGGNGVKLVESGGAEKKRSHDLLNTSHSVEYCLRSRPRVSRRKGTWYLCSELLYLFCCSQMNRTCGASLFNSQCLLHNIG